MFNVFSQISWTRSQPMSEDVTYVTYFLIGWDLGHVTWDGDCIGRALFAAVTESIVVEFCGIIDYMYIIYIYTIYLLIVLSLLNQRPLLQINVISCHDNVCFYVVPSPPPPQPLPPRLPATTTTTNTCNDIKNNALPPNERYSFFTLNLNFNYIYTG